MKWLPKFNGTNVVTTEKHKHELYWAMGARLISAEDVVTMLLFALNLEVLGIDT